MDRLYNCLRLFSTKIAPFRVLLLIYFIILTGSCVEVPVVSDKCVFTISLKNYSVNNSNTELLETKYLIKPNTSCVIYVTNIPEDVYFVLVQVHSYLKNMTLSYNVEPTRDSSVTGMNIGLLKLSSSSFLRYHLLYNSSVDIATVMIAVQAYGIDAPIPGGCNMEFQVEISPFLRTTFDEAITEVDFAPAAPSLPLFARLSTTTNNECNLKPDPIVYKLYQMYLPEGKFSEDLYFTALKSMMTVEDIKQNGHKIPDKTGISPMRHSFASYPGTGSVFVVVAETQDGSSVYVPSFTYACNISDQRNYCSGLTTTFSKLLCAAIFFLGLFACLAAHRFFRIQLLLLGFLSGTIICYVAALNFHSQMPLSLSVYVGLLCGTMFIIVLCFRGMPLFSLILSTSVLGYLLASLVLNELVDLFDIFQSDINYWFLFCAVMILAPIIMISLSEKANIIACSIVGSYASVLSIDYYIGSSLRYIFINTIRRATIPKFKHAIINTPFQEKDITLAVVWMTLALLGVVVQLLLMRGRPPYPAPNNPFKAIVNRLKPASRHPDERTPLLHSFS